MIEMINNEWLFLGGFLFVIFLISRFTNSQSKTSKSLEEQYKRVLTSEKYKVK
ncbi:hypothetical protein J4459_03175 [Candidatus Woesearchaeota archaeon]|nr:hypothetical protein [Candidatus Woesearchaeota archaeon]